MLPKNSGARCLTFQKTIQSIGILMIFIFTFSIPYRQCKTEKTTNHDVKAVELLYQFLMGNVKH